MSRSGYYEASDCEDYAYAMWNGAVKSALRGKRGQAFLREMLKALDALPNKRLIAGELVCGGGCCALGAVALNRGVDVSDVDSDDRDALSDVFGISGAMAAEVMYLNDERHGHASEEDRFIAMREWVMNKIRVTPEELAPPATKETL